jgi:hypothetical protein
MKIRCIKDGPIVHIPAVVADLIDFGVDVFIGLPWLRLLRARLDWSDPARMVFDAGLGQSQHHVTVDKDGETERLSTIKIECEATQGDASILHHHAALLIVVAVDHVQQSLVSAGSHHQHLAVSVDEHVERAASPPHQLGLGRVPLHRKHNLRGRGLGQGHLVGVVEREVRERAAGVLLYFRDILVPARCLPT